MIKVNLLRAFGNVTVDNIQAVEETPGSTADFLKNSIVIVLGALALFAHEMVNIPDLTEQLKVINAEIGEATRFNLKMDSLKREIQKYEKDQERLNSQSEFLRRVEKERLLSADLISKIKFYIPEKVWLSSISTNNQSVEIKGDAEGNGDVNEFNNRLSSAPFLKDVVIVSSTIKNTNRLSIQTFNIKANYVDGKQLIGEDGNTNLIDGVKNE